MPTTVYEIGMSGDDGDVRGQSSSYPPAGGDALNTTSSLINVSKNRNSSGVYTVRVGIVRFNTSTLPDNANFISARLFLYVTSKDDDSNRNLVGEWYEGGSIDLGDYSNVVLDSAFSAVDIGSISVGADKAIILQNLSNISKTGYTGIRLHIDGGAPTGTVDNDVTFAAGDHTSLLAARLEVVWDTSVQKTLTATPTATASMSRLKSKPKTMTASVVTTPSLSRVVDADPPSGIPASEPGGRELPLVTHEPGIRVRARHVVLGGGPGQVAVLAETYVPDFEGLDGPGGWQQGDYELRVYEEGRASLTFPNGAGSDGRLHRERFKIITDGKREPFHVSGQVVYMGGNYRPGDEFIEIWEGEPGEVAFVLVPTKATISRSRITIEGFDAFWLLKKTRETASGFWNHAPRDVWEHYTGVWRDFVSDNFEDGSVYDFDFSTTAYVNSDNGKWRYRIATNVGAHAGAPGTLRFVGTDDVSTARLESLSTITGGVGFAENPNLHCRVEARFRRDPLPPLGYVELILGTGNIHGFRMREDYVEILTSGYENRTVRLDTTAPGPFTVAIEIRGRWVYYYLDGTHVATTPRVASSTSGIVGFQVSGGAGTGAAYAELEFLRCKILEPFLLRGAAKGDYHFPTIAPEGGTFSEPTGSLGAVFFNESSERARVGDSDLTDWLLAPTKAPWASTLETSIWYPQGANGKLAGLPTGGPLDNEFISARWTGSVYLDIENKDYRFRITGSDRVRLWIGKTRHGEQIVDDWTAAGATIDTVRTSGWLKTDLAFHVNVDADSGWYPIVVEFSADAGTNGIVVEYQQSGWNANLWVALGESDYRSVIAADAPVYLFPLGDVRTDARDWGGTVVGTHTGAPNRAYIGGVRGTRATEFDGTDDVISCGDIADFAGTAPFSVEVWFRLDAIGEDHTVLGKTENASFTVVDGWDMFVWGGDNRVFFRRYVNGSKVEAVTTGAVTKNRWYHAVGVFTGTQLIVYLDGIAGTPVAASSSLAGHADAFLIGTSPDNFSAVSKLDGAIQMVSIYDFALTGTQVANHFAAAAVYNGVKVAPHGIFAQHVRFESHYDVIRALMDTFGYQARCEPRQLESGHFPGELVPWRRVGRDTEKVLTAEESVDYAATIAAEEVADVLIADASGLATENQASLVGEIADFPNLDDHLFITEEYESLSDVGNVQQLAQRLETLLALRGSSWEEIQAMPIGRRQLLDSWPLTGDLMAFAWEPGDGVRISLPELSVEDASPRQILGVRRGIVPAGIERHEVSFRQRPRSFRDSLRKIRRVALQQLRNYQGQIVAFTGTLGVSGGSGADLFSVLPLPESLSDIIRVTLSVEEKSDASAWRVEINGDSSALFNVTAVGRYDITGLFRQKQSGYKPYAQVKLITTGSSTGTWQIQIEALAVV
jgi:hypothetical protein